MSSATRTEVRGGTSRPRPSRSRLRLAVRLFGVACLAGGLAVGGYLGWQLWGTGLATARAQEDLRPRLERLVKEPRLVPTTPKAVRGARVAPPGEGVAILQIPRMGLDMVVVEGTEVEDLKKGPGHYTDTAMPWEDTGRVGIAGHRTTYGQPFWALNELRPGDRITLLTEFGRFDYRVTRSVVILPHEGWVLEPTKRPTLVLTTCEPRFSASHRLVVFADRE